MAAAQRGPHIFALLSEAIEMMHAEALAKVEERFAEIIYLDEIEHLLGSEKWKHLNILSLAMVPQGYFGLVL